MYKKVYSLFISRFNDFICSFFKCYCVFTLIFLVSNNSYSQCTGNLGKPKIFKDFGSGTSLYNNTPASGFGFSTTFANWNKPNTQDGFYSIVNEVPKDFLTNGVSVWHNGAQDHTPGDVNGYMLLVNGDQSLGEFYRDTAVGLCKGATYEFSSYLANIFKPAGGIIFQSSPPKVRFEIRNMNNVIIDSISSGEILTSSILTWIKFGITFNSPASSVILVMVSTAPSGTGNDIAIDDIAFSPCTPSAAISKLVSTCENNNTIVKVDVTGNADFRFSQWQKSKDRGITWSDTGAIITQTSSLSAYSVSLNLTNININEDSTLFRLILSTDPSYLINKSNNCISISDTSLLVVYKSPIVLITSDTIVCNQPIDLTLATYTKKSTFTSNTTLSYYTTALNATTNTNALSITNIKAIKSTNAIGSIFYIKASISTDPNCAAIKPIKVTINELKTLKLNSQIPVCKDSAVFTSIAVVKNISSISWRKSSSPTILQNNSNTSLQVTSTIAELAKDSVWIIATSSDNDTGLGTCPNVKDSIKVKFFDPPTIQAPADTSFCLNKALVLLPLKATMKATNEIEWSTSGAVKPSPLTGLTTFLAINDAINQKIYIKAQTKGCRPVIDSVQIKTEKNDTIRVTGPLNICSKTPLVNAVLTTTSTAGILWKANGILFSPNASANSITYTPTKVEIDSGSVTLKAMTLFKTGQLCPTVSDSIKVAINILPSLQLSDDTTFCFLQNPTLLSLSSVLANADSLIWRTNNTINPTPKNGATTSLSIPTTSSFKVFGTAYKKGCIPVKDSLIVSLETQPKVSATATFTCLPNLQVNLIGAVSITNKGIWSSSGNGSFSSIAVNITPNSYIPSKQDIEKSDVSLKLSSIGQTVCPAAETSLVYKIVPLPKASVVKDSLVCINSSINLTTSQNANWKYEWRRIKSGAILSGTNKLSFVANLDTNLVYLKVSNSRSCDAFDSSVIASITPPIIAVSPSLCLYSAQNILATVTNPPSAGKYEWKRNNSNLGFSNASLPINIAGNYSYHFSFGNGCISSASMQALDVPKLKVADTSACQNGKTAIIANLIPNATYFWGTPAVTTSSNKFDITVTTPIPSFKVLIIDQNNCKDSTTIKISISPAPKFSISGSDLCDGEVKKLKAQLDALSQAPTYFSWSRDGIPIQSSNWVELEYNQGGNYSLTLGNRGCFETKTKTLKSNPNPKIDIPLQYKYCFESDSPLSLVSNPFKNYVWRSETKTIDTTQSVLVTPERDSYYFLNVKNEFGCKDSTKVLVRKVCPPRLFVPNVVTPESQDVNAGLRIFGANYTNFEITVFSRWGEVIFYSKDPNNTWNGEYLNNKMPIGNYQWQVSYEGDTEEYKGPYKKTGDVTIVR